ncbi:hypothetical protein [Alistipes putredinis]|uniref:hypothetical protein n=1 Tax=Alistipes putredinis TaxID=28117 RepID=UPI003F7BD1BE
MSDATEIVTNDFNITDGYICTLDRTTDNGKVAIAKALNGSEPLKDHMDEVLHLAGVITTPGTRSQTGAECTNNYLVLDDGTVLFSQSDGVTRSLKVIAALWSGDLHDGKTIDVKCISQNLTNGNTLKTIVPA